MMKQVYGVISQILYKKRSQFAIPTQLGLAVTSACNIKCAYCMRETFKPKPAIMRLNQFRKLLKNMPFIQGVCIMGLCEPLLNPDLKHIIELAGINDKGIALTTNGTIPFEEGLLSRLKYVGDMVFSIDSPDPQTFKAMRGGANLSSVMVNMRSVLQWKKDNGRGRFDNPPIHINAVISEKNF